jgi:solute carrier family 25 S-adenosylmethionine transporter 26
MDSSIEISRAYWNNLVAGGVAGCAVDVSLYPLDSIKTRLQTIVRGNNLNWANPYAGIGPALIGSFPASATFWVTYAATKDSVDSLGLGSSPAVKHLLGATAGSITSSLIRTPFEILKQQMQVGVYDSLIDASQKTYSRSGFRGFFVGVNSLILREIPFESVQFLTYEYLKHEDYGRTSEISCLEHLLHGGFAGGLAAFVTTPIDVAKTRVMVEGRSLRSTYKEILRILRNEGWRSLWKGWHLRVLLTTVGGMIFFGTYEVARRSLRYEM